MISLLQLILNTSTHRIVHTRLASQDHSRALVKTFSQRARRERLVRHSLRTCDENEEFIFAHLRSKGEERRFFSLFPARKEDKNGNVKAHLQQSHSANANERVTGERNSSLPPLISSGIVRVYSNSYSIRLVPSPPANASLCSFQFA